jgi:hypothetical protein
MNPVRASDYSGILARMAWVFQGLPSERRTAGFSQREEATLLGARLRVTDHAVPIAVSGSRSYRLELGSIHICMGSP